jgi:hypothetical protein
MAGTDTVIFLVDGSYCKLVFRIIFWLKLMLLYPVNCMYLKICCVADDCFGDTRFRRQNISLPLSNKKKCF